MVEGGSELLGAFLSERLVDAVALYRAPLLLGGRDGMPVFGGPTPLRLAEALALRSRAERPLFELWYPVESR
jgi:riboflavin biosynthesis pyrimidine reductase